MTAPRTAISTSAAWSLSMSVEPRVVVALRFGLEPGSPVRQERHRVHRTRSPGVVRRLRRLRPVRVRAARLREVPALPSHSPEQRLVRITTSVGLAVPVYPPCDERLRRPTVHLRRLGLAVRKAIERGMFGGPPPFPPPRQRCVLLLPS